MDIQFPHENSTGMLDRIVKIKTEYLENMKKALNKVRKEYKAEYKSFINKMEMETEEVMGIYSLLTIIHFIEHNFLLAVEMYRGCDSC